MLVSSYGQGVATDLDSTRLRRQFDAEKKEEMKRFTEAVKEKWEDAVVSLKEEMTTLKEENTKLRSENNALREEAGNSPVPAPSPDASGDTVQVLRNEFVALMEAAAMGVEGGDGSVAQDLKTQVSALEADLALQKSIAASAQEQAQQQTKRADGLASRLDAAEDALKKMSAELELLNSQSSKSASPPVPTRSMPPLPAAPPPRASQSPSKSPQDSSSWIARYKAIVNSPL